METRSAYAEEGLPAMKFKPGDTVKCIENNAISGYTTVGGFYTVLRVDACTEPCVKLKEGWPWFTPEQFELAVAAPEKKDTNPKDAVGTGKVPMSTVPFQVMGELGLALLEGARKYGRHNYRVAGVRASVYLDAFVLRHIGAWWEGEDIDPDSGLSHVTKAIASLVVLRDSMLQGNWVDDRPPRAVNQDWIRELNAKAKALVEKYPNPVSAHTEKKQ